MPRFRKERATALTTSSSQPERMAGSASNTVTLHPRSAKREANSQPMAPPPTTATDAGRPSRARTSSDVITREPSTSKPGMVRGSEPAANTMSVPVISEMLPSGLVTRTRWSGSREPLPMNVVTPRPFSRPSSPCHSWSTTCCFRAWLTAKSKSGGGASPSRTLIPNRAEPLTVR